MKQDQSTTRPTSGREWLLLGVCAIILFAALGVSIWAAARPDTAEAPVLGAVDGTCDCCEEDGSNDNCALGNQDELYTGSYRSDVQITATIPPLGMIAQSVVGDIAHVETLLPSGSTPHGYEPTVSDATRAARTNMLLRVGGDFDAWMTPLVPESVPSVALLDVSDPSVDAHAQEDHAEEETHVNTDEHGLAEDEHVHEDPHVWLHPHVAVRYARVLAEQLSPLLPEYESELQRNAEQFEEDVESTYSRLRDRFQSKYPNSTLAIVTMHDAYEPMAEAFGFTIAGSYEPTPGEQVSVRALTTLREQVQARDARFFAAERQLMGLDPDQAQRIACDLDLQLVVLEPLGTFSSTVVGASDTSRSETQSTSTVFQTSSSQPRDITTYTHVLEYNIEQLLSASAETASECRGL